MYLRLSEILLNERRRHQLLFHVSIYKIESIQHIQQQCTPLSVAIEQYIP